MKTRIEHDLLGNKEVPMDAYYGVQTLRAIENFRRNQRIYDRNVPELREGFWPW